MSAAAAIQAQIDAARDAAAKVATEGNAGGAVVNQTNTGGAVGTAVQPGRPVSLGEVLNQGGLGVDMFLKVDKAGFMIGTDTLNTYDELDVEFRLGDVVPYFCIRFGQSPTKYLKSFDRLVESRTGKSWADAQRDAMAADPKCRGDYPTVDIPFTIRETLVATKGDKKGQDLIKAGQTLGVTLSITNFKDFKNFIKPFDDLRQAGQIDDNLILAGKLLWKPRTGNGNNWGAAVFDEMKVVDVSWKDSQAEG